MHKVLGILVGVCALMALMATATFAQTPPTSVAEALTQGFTGLTDNMLAVIGVAVGFVLIPFAAKWGLKFFRGSVK